MSVESASVDCQIPCLQHIAEGGGEVPPESLARRLKLGIRRRLSPATERQIKQRSNDMLNWLYARVGKNTKPLSPPPALSSPRLSADDVVRVRSREEIEATLNQWRQLRGCAFMPEMAQYCGTTQRVLKSMRRFVDERDLRVKKCSGIILLEGVLCQGTAEFGACDRSCHVFWREEWLERIP